MPRARRLAGLGLLLVLAAASATAATPEESLRAVLSNPEYVEVSGFEGVSVDLRYASTNNFVQENV